LGPKSLPFEHRPNFVKRLRFDSIPWRTVPGRILQRTRASASFPTGRRPWTWTLAATAVYGSVALVFGFTSGWLESTRSELTGPSFLRMAFVLLLFPGFAEELVFRVWLLPHPVENVRALRKRCALVGSVAVFTLWHVINAWLFFPEARPVFWDGRFLFLAAGLGGTCGVVYLRWGSIWPPALIHWGIVLLWKACFGGPVFFE